HAVIELLVVVENLQDFRNQRTVHGHVVLAKIGDRLHARTKLSLELGHHRRIPGSWQGSSGLRRRGRFCHRSPGNRGGCSRSGGGAGPPFWGGGGGGGGARGSRFAAEKSVEAPGPDLVLEAFPAAARRPVFPTWLRTEPSRK